jgi:hypothetical protein
MVCSIDWNGYWLRILYFLAAVATAFAVGVPRIPHISEAIKKGEEE